MEYIPTDITDAISGSTDLRGQLSKMDSALAQLGAQSQTSNFSRFHSVRVTLQGYSGVHAAGYGESRLTLPTYIPYLYDYPEKFYGLVTWKDRVFLSYIKPLYPFAPVVGITPGSSIWVPVYYSSTVTSQTYNVDCVLSLWMP